ncbi:MAG TPA: serine protease, partial [Alphaproteobacteria bacterium]|nr:serine protease [Alphaproteobacteria bacterium]
VVVSKVDAIAVAVQTGTLPDNVNFAVKGHLAKIVLERSGVQYESRASTRLLTAVEVAKLAKGFRAF